jgi:hypothetical protein
MDDRLSMRSGAIYETVSSKCGERVPDDPTRKLACDIGPFNPHKLWHEKQLSREKDDTDLRGHASALHPEAS